MMLETIKWTAERILDNISEAREYMCKANALYDSNRQAADWCKEMAQAHMQFNATGFTLLKKSLDEFGADEKHVMLAPGVKAVYMAMHGDMLKETAETRALIEMYGK